MMRVQHGRARKLSIFMVLYMLLTAVMPMAALADGPTGGVPQVTVPKVSLPQVEMPTAEVHVPDAQVRHLPGQEGQSIQPSGINPLQGTSSSVHKPNSLGAKDVFKKIARMTIGGREVIYNASIAMEDSGKFKQGGWRTARAYTLKLMSPWVDLLPFDALDLYFDADSIVGQSKNIKKSYDLYEALKAATPKLPPAISTASAPAAGAAAAGRMMGASFPIVGGTVGMVTGTWDIMDSLSSAQQADSNQQTVKFYSGIGSVVSGAGSVLGGVAVIAAGTAAAPGLAVAGTVLLAAGLVCGAAALAMKHSPAVRNSRIGRRLSGFKNWIGS